jgi:uncharacterized membrane protein
MATFSVWKFDTPDGAERAEQALVDLQKQELIKIVDAATVSWPPGRSRPRTKQNYNTTAAGALSGSFWGFLFGLIFFLPLLGAAVGAAAGALSGSMRDVGIDDDFIRSVRDTVTPGTSALFVMTRDAVLDRVRDAFEGQRAELIHTNLSDEQEAKLHDLFDEDD